MMADSGLWTSLEHRIDEPRLRRWLRDARAGGAHLERNERGGWSLVATGVDGLLPSACGPRLLAVLDDLAEAAA